MAAGPGSPRRRRWPLVAAAVLAVAGAAAWHWQSQLIGIGARWYLARIAAGEEANGELGRRRDAVARMHRMLLLAPPDDALVPELFDLVTQVSARVASGQIDYAWAAYVYTSYERDLTRERRAGAVRRTLQQVEAAVEDYVRFYALQQRPDAPGVRLRDLAGAPAGNSYTVEEIEEAARQGRDLSAE